MKNKKLYNYLPNLIISLFLAFIFLALSLLFAADNIFFEPTTYTNSMHKIKIEDTAFQEIQTYCEQQYAYTGVEADTPVSYTHLDVYKRQLQLLQTYPHLD